jgi:energy-coupling factor transport system permease protein
MNNKMVFGQYYNHPSWVHNLDPRTKIIAIFLFMVTVFILSSIEALLVAFGLILVVILSTGIPIGKFLNSLKMMTMLLVFTVFFQVLFNTRGELLSDWSFQLQIGHVLLIIGLIVLYTIIKKTILPKSSLLFLGLIFAIFYVQYRISFSSMGFLDVSLSNYAIRLYDEGFFTAVKIIIRIVSLIFISSLLTLSTKPTDLNLGLEAVMRPLRRIGIKVNILAMMISIALRFIPTLVNESEKILKAQASRGVDFKEGKLKDKIIQIISLLIPMFVISYKRAEDLAEAMEARGYSPEGERTSINLLVYRMADYCSLSFTSIAIITIIVLKVIGYAI